VSALIRTFGSTFGWGVFCAASWTWCIGMFLPLLMIDRFGWWGFIAFAAPNVLGCAAFGYVVGRRERSERMVRDHRMAMRVFSVVTIAYHIFFLAMLCWLFLPAEMGEERLWLAIITPPAILSIGVVLSNLPDRAWPMTAIAAYAVSLAAFASIGIQPLADVPWSGRIEQINLWWLAPTLIFGFLLCPYLDLTFHRALQQSPSRHAFSIFGITFLVMIILTCAYWNLLTDGLKLVVAAHIVVQTCFTVAVHVREVRLSDDAQGGVTRINGRNTERRRPLATGIRSWWLLLLLTLLALPLAMAGEFIGEPRDTALDMYVRFLVFYGLIFPAYVLMFMAYRFGSPERTPPRLGAIAAFFIVAASIYELGFVHHMYHLLPIPLAAALLWWGYLTIRHRDPAEMQP
jgi:hypothetical protein